MTLFKLKNITFRINLLVLIMVIILLYIGYIMETITVIATVLIHELTHIIAAKRMGVKVKQLEIFPFGGVAKFDSFIGTDPKIEIIIAFIGPMTNMFAALIFKMIRVYYPNVYLLDLFINANVYMGTFNFIPVFPLDGGRILRGILSYQIGFKLSTKILTFSTYILSFLLIFIGVLYLDLKEKVVYLIVLAVFISIAANKEKRMAAFIFIKEITEKKLELRKKGVLKSHNIVVLKDVTAEEVLKNFLPKRFHIIVIVDQDGNIVKIISETNFLEGVIKNGTNVKLEKLLNNNKKW